MLNPLWVLFSIVVWLKKQPLYQNFTTILTLETNSFYNLKVLQWEQKLLLMANLEENFLRNNHNKPQLYLGYIDDIFLLWTHG